MFQKSFIPHKGYWSSPFSRWQMSFQNINSIELGAATTRKFLETRGYEAAMFDGCVLGMTIGQKSWFYANPWFCAMMGNDRISGPTVSQACATGATSIYTACMGLESDTYQNMLVATTDRCSNGPHTIWPNPKGPGGEVISENWLMDNFNQDPYGKEAMVKTAENVAADNGGVSKEESDAMAVRRYEQYLMSTADDSAFQKEYMIPVDVKISKKKTITVEADEGISPCTPEGLAPLKPVVPGGCISFGAQTHPADGNAGLIVTTKEKARELSQDKSVTIQVLSYGYARAKKAHMAAAVTPAAEMALAKAGLEVKDLSAVKTHNPFTVNDIIMGRLMGIPGDIFNNYGSSMVFGHPQGPTGTRCTVELIEELIKLGGGYGLFAGCAAGDTAAALVIKVN
ncbi:thiolase family protein [Dethiosulfatarculus sandiegensis]|uniref:Thiolase n=1 Tax=Dethiosulfatarculus sandiegensis TaxID=1429043 RepID=A0A0D2J7I7_9BACT|nr:thiolase family protein [Dethiosulfatarculus sandiegensis]KIX14174.1 thiolase [Dethiosulfatarculus sandiegensis]